jgi:tetratricopeptide (TPR) repeat protein
LESAARAKARAVLEDRLETDPANSAAAEELAELLVEIQEHELWTALRPTQMQSEGGATLTLQNDDSVLASGMNPDRDTYVLIAPQPLEEITAVRLDVLPDRSLPFGGSGRAVENGNFALSNFTLAKQTRDSTDIPRPAGWSDAWSDHRLEPDVHYNKHAMHIGMAIDGDSQTYWEAWPKRGSPHQAILLPGESIGGQGQPLRFVLEFKALVKHNLGRFRLSVSGNPTALDQAQKQFAAINLTDPWARLGAAYLAAGDTGRAADLLERPEGKDVFASWLDGGFSVHQVLDALQARHPARYTALLPGLASTAAERGRIDHARALYERLAEWQPENALWHERIEQLRPGVNALWNFDTGLGQWGNASHCELSVQNGVLTARTTGHDPQFSTPAGGRSGGHALVLRYRARNSFTMQIYWADSYGGFDESRHLDCPIPAAAGEWRETTLPFVSQGRLTALRLDLNTAGEHPLEIDSIILRQLEPGDVEMIPANADLLIALAADSQSAGRTRDAVGMLAVASLGKPQDTILSMKVAALQVWFGMEQEYAATRQQILASAKDTGDVFTADRAAKACSLLTSSDPAELQAALALGRKAVKLGQGGGAWNLLALGMAEYRLGNYPAADRALRAAAEADRDNAIVTGMSPFYRAMSLFRQGQADEARQLAIETAEKMRPLPADDQNPLSGNADHDTLMLWLAYKEAKALINF